MTGNWILAQYFRNCLLCTAGIWKGTDQAGTLDLGDQNFSLRRKECFRGTLFAHTQMHPHKTWVRAPSGMARLCELL